MTFLSRFNHPSRLVLGVAATLITVTACGGDDDKDPAWETSGGSSWPPVPTVVAHRGASALRPEHTIEAYKQAIEDGADFIEPDLVITKDGVLVARHENAIAILNADGSVREATTDVIDRPEFASRKTTKTIDGSPITGWFTEDFTLAELKTLRARERIPAIRPGNVRYNGQFSIPTFQEVIDLARSESDKRGRTIGVYPETKHPTFFQSIGKPLEAPLVAVLAANKLTTRDAPVIIQSFEVANLQQLGTMTAVRIAQLISDGGRPYDFIAKGAAETRSYADLITPAGLQFVKTYATGIGPYKTLIIPVQDGKLGTPTALAANAKAAGLPMHIWTLRPENSFLPASFKKAPVADATVRGDSVGEITAYLNAGVEGFFTDDPAVGRQAVNAFLKK